MNEITLFISPLKAESVASRFLFPLVCLLCFLKSGSVASRFKKAKSRKERETKSGKAVFFCSDCPEDQYLCAECHEHQHVLNPNAKMKLHQVTGL